MKIVQESKKRQYELTFLLDGTYTDTERSGVEKKIEALIKKHDGKVVSQDDWGKKNTAYTIKRKGKKFSQAFYSHWIVEFETENAPVFEKDLFLNQQVVRHLFVLAEANPESTKKEDKVAQVEEAEEANS